MSLINRENAIKELMSWLPKLENGLIHWTGVKAMLENLPTVNPDGWIPCEDRLPKCEQEVLICTKKKVYVSKKTGMEWYEESVITPAIYEDGTMLEVNSIWRWEDIDYAGWDEEEDCGIIPEGWWENRHFNPDDVYNNIVDKKVIAWMPLPKPYEPKEDK